jgi:hypothetical protein
VAFFFEGGVLFVMDTFFIEHDSNVIEHDSKVMPCFLDKMVQYLGESDLYCFARTCTLFYNVLYKNIPYRVCVSRESFQSLSVLDFLQSEGVIGFISEKESHLKTYQKTYDLEDATKCALHTKWMMRHLYCHPKDLLRFIVLHDCVDMAAPVFQFLENMDEGMTTDFGIGYSQIKSVEMYNALKQEYIEMEWQTHVPWTSTDSISVLVQKWDDIRLEEHKFLNVPENIFAVLAAWLHLPKSNWKSKALYFLSYMLHDDDITLPQDLCDRMTCWDRIHFDINECECDDEIRHQTVPGPRKKLKSM